MIILCLVLILILFKQLRTTNKLLETTQDKFHTKLSALENKYSSSIGIKSVLDSTKEMDITPTTRYDAIVNNIPIYTRKFFAATNSIIFTAFILYSLYSSAIKYYQSYYRALGIPYLEGTTKINPWFFYVSHPQLLIALFVAMTILLLVYSAGWLDAITPKNTSLTRKTLSSFFIIAVVSVAYLEFFLIQPWWYTLIFLTISTTALVLVQIFSNKKAPEKLALDQQNNKVIFYSISFGVILYNFLWFPIAVISANNFIASYSGKKLGEQSLIIITDDKYLKSRNHIILKATQENIYLLDCEGSECTGLRKINDDKVALTFFERKDFTFYSESKEKTD